MWLLFEDFASVQGLVERNTLELFISFVFLFSPLRICLLFISSRMGKGEICKRE